MVRFRTTSIFFVHKHIVHHTFTYIYMRVCVFCSTCAFCSSLISFWSLLFAPHFLSSLQPEDIYSWIRFVKKLNIILTSKIKLFHLGFLCNCPFGIELQNTSFSLFLWNFPIIYLWIKNKTKLFRLRCCGHVYCNCVLYFFKLCTLWRHYFSWAHTNGIIELIGFSIVVMKQISCWNSLYLRIYFYVPHSVIIRWIAYQLNIVCQLNC